MVIGDGARIAAEHLLFLRYGFVTYRAHLYHALRTDGTCTWWRFQRGYERKVGFFLGIGTTVEQSYRATGILQCTRVTNERGRIDCGRLSFA